MTRVSREAPVHDAILRYLRLRFPRGLVVHAANELDMAGPAAARQVAKAKHRGMVPGWPDLQLLLPDGNACFFEVKAEGGRVSDAQRDVLGALTRLGFRVAVVRSVRDVEDALSEWDVDGVSAWQSIGNVAARLQKRLATDAADARNKSGPSGAGNTDTALTITSDRSAR